LIPPAKKYGLPCDALTLARLFALTITYFLAGWLGLKLPYGESHITLVWLPTGIAVAALLRWGRAVWPGVYLGAFLVNLSIGSAWPLAAGIAVGNTLGPLLAVGWLKRTGFRSAFESQRDVGLFIAAAGLGMAVSAAGGVANLFVAGLVPLESMSSAWLSWWMGDTVGVLLGAPLLLTLTRKNIRQLSSNRKQLLLWTLVAGPAAWLAFIHDYGQGHRLPLAFMTLALLPWAALRFGNTGAALAGMAFSMIAAWGTATGHGTFFLPDHRISLFLLWSYMAITVLTGLLITALQAERLTMEGILRESEEKLRALYELSPLGIALTDIKGRYIDFNQAFLNICGYSEDELKALDYWTLTPEKYKTDEERQLESLERTGRYGPYEKEYARKDGSLIPLRLNGLSITLNDGQKYIWSIVEDISDRKAAEEEIKELAFYDPLTRLPNRRLLFERLHQALAANTRSRLQGALLFIDLDDFKTINDTLGHDKGDMLLQQVAKSLSACVREGDTVARLGGDEFVVMLEGLSEGINEAAAQSESVGKKILAALDRTYVLNDQECHSTTSIGITLFGIQRETMDQLLRQADMAMYQAKAAGRNALRFFDPEMQITVTGRVALERDLRTALREGQFVLYYQAQLDDEGEIAGAEVLVRWQHPQRGLVFPDEFIPLAEETGLILPLGLWVLETACAQLAAWANQAHTARLTLAVNVSIKQLRQPDFVEQVLTVLERTGANPLKVKLEITESQLMDKTEGTIAKMIALKAKGVGFALDDFGTGYSSLSYLKRLPLEKLKIDKSFVADVLTDQGAAAIAKTIVALARSLGMDVIAEGVETEAQRIFLAQNDCYAYQGYLFSRPLPLENFESLLTRPKHSQSSP
jgi:diguanylate cyclase (GGDEF)-like protein/PAS domain S-box-containing protein